MQKYWAGLEAATTSKGYLARFTARTPKATRPLRRLLYATVGQHKVAKEVMESLDVFALHRKDTKKLLVIVFSGPSSHGKTELARAAARLCAGVAALGDQNFVCIPVRIRPKRGCLPCCRCDQVPLLVTSS